MLASSSLLGTRSEVSTLHGVRLKPYALLQGGFKKPYDLLHSPSLNSSSTKFFLSGTFGYSFDSGIPALHVIRNHRAFAPAFAFNVPWHKHPHLSCFCTRIRIYRAVARASASHCAFALRISMPAFHGLCVSASFGRYLGFSRVKSYRSLIQSRLMFDKLQFLTLGCLCCRLLGTSQSCTPILSGYPSADASYTPTMAGGTAEGFPIAPGSPWGWALSRLLHMQTESASAIHKLTFSRPRGTSVRENRVCGSAVIDDRSLSLLTLMSTPPVSPCLRSLSSSLWFFLAHPPIRCVLKFSFSFYIYFFCSILMLFPLLVVFPQ
ncbi:hypothetical protein R3P38DRAFT_1367230 [Favolaschia claudopus]|uniref:Cytochrome c biogenesis B n=1 Tax=Favolaschia claudopus TaxID=2862362 RepID=A0AAW0DUS7_9AGAR